MKKILIIVFLFLSIKSFAQSDTALGLRGKKIPLKSLSLLHPLYNPNDSTAAFDSARYYLATFAYNGTNDSLVITFLDGTRLAVAKPVSTGGTGSGWKTVNTNDMTDTLSGNVAIGNGLNTPKAKLQVSNSGLGVTISDSSKGILLSPIDTATLGNQVWSPPLTWQASQYLTTPGRSQPVTVQARMKSIQGTTSANGYLSYMVWKSLTTYQDDVMAIGINASTGTTGVGFGMSPNNTSGAIASFNGSIYQASGVLSVPSTWSINQFGSNFLDFGASNSSLLRLLYGSSYRGLITDKPVAIGRNDSTDLGAQFSVTSTGRGFLFPRMTTTQRDSINLRITGFTIANGGTGYTGLGPSLTASTGPVPTSATTASFASIGWTISGGVLTAVSGGIQFGGSYNSTPTLTLSGGGGTGAVIYPVMTQFLTEGMTIYNLTVHKLQTWDGTAWQNNF